jgi:hypothetical protein
MGAFGTNGVGRCLTFVAAEIFENDVARARRSESLLSGNREEFAVGPSMIQGALV